VARRAVFIAKVVVMVLAVEMLQFVAAVVALEVAAIVLLTAVATIVRHRRAVRCERECCTKDQTAHRVPPVQKADTNCCNRRILWKSQPRRRLPNELRH